MAQKKICRKIFGGEMNKFFNTNWSAQDISDYLSAVGILILFEIEINFFNKEAKVIVHGDFSLWDKDLVRDEIMKKFGGKDITDEVCILINEYAEKWYNKKIKRRKARVVNKVAKK